MTTPWSRGVGRAAVLGCGSWGTAFAKVLADAGATTTLLARRPEVAARIRDTSENPDYLPGVRLPARLTATHDPAEALAGAELVVLAVPSQTLRANLTGWAALLPGDAILVSLMKGIERGSALRMSEVVCAVAGVRPARIGVVSGPNLAREIAEEHPAATVVASSDAGTAALLSAACATGYLRPYTNSDVIGCELGGAVKNIIALACGMAEGMAFGDNTKASIITRGLAETARLGVALGADPVTFSGLAGLGDLVATCMSPLSRNRTVGELLGRGLTLGEVVARTRQTAEGVASSRSVLDLATRHGVDMPITEQVVGVVEGGLHPREVIAALMGRGRTAE